VGSLIRLPELLALIEAKQDGTSVDDGVFADALRSSVAEIVRQQASTNGASGSRSSCERERPYYRRDQSCNEGG
jgi:hypothetical protein